MLPKPPFLPEEVRLFGSDSRLQREINAAWAEDQRPDVWSGYLGRIEKQLSEATAETRKTALAILISAALFYLLHSRRQEGLEIGPLKLGATDVNLVLVVLPVVFAFLVWYLLACFVSRDILSRTHEAVYRLVAPALTRRLLDMPTAPFLGRSVMSFVALKGITPLLWPAGALFTLFWFFAAAFLFGLSAWMSVSMFQTQGFTLLTLVSAGISTAYLFVALVMLVEEAFLVTRPQLKRERAQGGG